MDTYSSILAGSAQKLMARVTDTVGDLLTAAAVASVSVAVFDRDTGNQIGSTQTPSPSTVIFSSLQTDPTWTRDTTGYNFAIVLPGTFFPAGDTTYRVEVTITPVGGDAFIVIWNLPAISTYTG